MLYMISCLISDMISQVDDAEKALKMKIRPINAARLPEGSGFESVHPSHYVWRFTFFPEQIIFFIRTMIS